MALSTQDVERLIESAKTAQQRRYLAEAERLWREVLAARANDRTANVGLAGVLLANGRIEEARPLVAQMMRETPRDVSVLTLAARIAADAQDWPSAVAAWRAVLSARAGVTAAIIGLGSALIANGEIEEARAFADGLARQRLKAPFGPMLRARIALAEGDAERSIEILREAVTAFPHDQLSRRDLARTLMSADRFEEAKREATALSRLDREAGLVILGDIMARRDEPGQLEFWQRACSELPGNGTFLRRLAAAALRAGNVDQTARAMTELAKVQADVQDAALVVGLAHVYAARGDIPGLRAAVRGYLTSLKRTAAYRFAALRLSRIVLAYFVGPNGARARPINARENRMVERTPLQPRVRSVCARSLGLQAQLAAEARAMIDTDASRDETAAFVSWLRERMARRQPTSMVRMNDGEGSAFAYEPAYAAHYDNDSAEREHVWWGRAVGHNERRTIAAKVAAAAWHADAIGIPSFPRILRDLNLLGDKALTNSRTGRGLLAGVAAFERWPAYRPAGLPPPLFLSANVQQDLQRWNMYGELFDGAGPLVLVSCHPDLPDAMRAQFGVETATHVLIPPRHYSIPLLNRRAETPKILPEVIDDIVRDVCAAASGRVVVVGAGYLGKWIIHQARRAGGIALDLGSALDYWVGLKTRSFQDLA
jgi:predicted Zn-dependent protease